jgi:2'-5' RNA ligase
MPVLRAFIAIELDGAALGALGAVQQRLKKAPGAQHVNWVAPESMHLTLKFIGDLDSGRVAQVLEAMRHACAGAAPFELTLEGLGAFPSLNRPNVVWAGVGGRVASAGGIARRLEDECAGLGIERESRPFSPHLTLGRVRREASSDEQALVGESVRRLAAGVGEIGRFGVRAIHLMRSDLKPAGPVYSSLGEIALAEPTT